VTIAAGKDGFASQAPDGASPSPEWSAAIRTSLKWKAADTVCATRGERDGQRQIFFYTSADMQNWRKKNRRSRSHRQIAIARTTSGFRAITISLPPAPREGREPPRAMAGYPASSLGVPKTGP